MGSLSPAVCIAGPISLSPARLGQGLWASRLPVGPRRCQQAPAESHHGTAGGLEPTDWETVGRSRPLAEPPATITYGWRSWPPWA